jgi:hypothetical protein
MVSLFFFNFTNTMNKEKVKQSICTTRNVLKNYFKTCSYILIYIIFFYINLLYLIQKSTNQQGQKWQLFLLS